MVTATSATHNRLDTMAPEVIYKILSFMSYREVYLIRGVCRKFQVMGEYHIYQQVKSVQQSIIIKLDGSDNKKCVELRPTSFDTKNKIIEFRPIDGQNAISLANESNHWSSAYHRLIKIHFSEWLSSQQLSSQSQKTCYTGQKPGNIPFTKLSPQDQAVFLYHYQYNSALEKLYELPSWSSMEALMKQADNDDSTTRYLGDKGLILSLSYSQTKQQYQNLLQQSPVTHTSYYSTSNSSMSVAPKMHIKWLRVTLDWILNGNQQQIYEERFSKLNELLAKAGCFKYNPLTEPILRYIVSDQSDSETQQQPAVLPGSLISYCLSHTHECHTRLSRLQHMLEGAGVDSQVIWKYSFAKSFVVGNGSLLCEEDVIRRIQDSEEEWRHKKPVLLRKLLLCPVA